MERNRLKFNSDKGLCLLSAGCLFVFLLSSVPKLVTGATSLKCSLESCNTLCEESNVETSCDDLPIELRNHHNVIRNDEKMVNSWPIETFFLSSEKSTLLIRGPPFKNS
jgi:hypothetical protein